MEHGPTHRANYDWAQVPGDTIQEAATILTRHYSVMADNSAVTGGEPEFIQNHAFVLVSVHRVCFLPWMVNSA